MKWFEKYAHELFESLEQIHHANHLPWLHLPRWHSVIKVN